MEVTSAARNCEMKRYSVVRPAPSSAVAALTAAGSRLVPPVAKRVRMTSAQRLARAQTSSSASASAPLLATNLPPTLHDSQSRISCSPATARSEYPAVSPAFPSSYLTDLPRSAIREFHTTRQEEPGAGKPPARICEGGAAKWPSYSTTTISRNSGHRAASIVGVIQRPRGRGNIASISQDLSLAAGDREQTTTMRNKSLLNVLTPML